MSSTLDEIYYAMNIINYFIGHRLIVMFSLSDMNKVERKNNNVTAMKCSTPSKKIDSDIPKSMHTFLYFF